MEPLFLDAEDILGIQRRSVDKYGGLHGLRDENSFLSAVQAPLNLFIYDDKADLFDLAAAYAYHIAEAQAFLDGNKRAGAGASMSFLHLNGVELPSSADVILYDVIIGISRRELGKFQLAAFLRVLAISRENFPELR